MKIRVKLSNSLRYKNVEVGLVFSLLGVILFAIVQLSNSKAALAFTSGDFRSITSGSWNSTSTWQEFNGTAWVAATSTPVNTDGKVTIQTGHTVAITSALNADQIVVARGATLVLNKGISLSIKKSSVTDLHVYGTFRNSGILKITPGVKIIYESGGLYERKVN